MAGRGLSVVAVAVWASALVVAAERQAPSSSPNPHRADTSQPGAVFEPGDTCMVCHNNILTRTGDDVSIGTDWRATMMANSARDPYWQAAVRRELMDHPQAGEAIEDECSICHMPMTTFPARAGGGKGRIFDHLPLGRPDDDDAVWASDGVSCTVCHQIQASGLGSRASFTGGYVIDTSVTSSPRRVFGPFEIDRGRTRVMQSSSGFEPAKGTQMQQSELCATCHTLFTHSLAAGASDRRLPEQVPYLEWQQSAYRDSASCQSCHMPVVHEDVPVSQVVGQPRADVSRHTFLGGNFFALRMLNRFRDELGVRATPKEMESVIARTVEHLTTSTASVELLDVSRDGAELRADVRVRNLAGHKFPTAYPSRRAWIHLRVTDAADRIVFESGAVQPDGRIAGNDQDADAARFEPHYAEVRSVDEVQIYESMMVDPSGKVTTGLLSGARYIKDNRLLPRGLSRAAASEDVAVHGEAREDADFGDGQDIVRYRVPVQADGPLTVTATLYFQPIGFRWAENLKSYDAPEPARFVRYYQSMASESALAIATASVVR
ncbi:MAG: hypothetical protein JNM38_04820 [Acidobacteria bacterium]|jgi:hypothetical protein|nr:hypothetical protein [Acidobacteriota bacterium]